MEGNQLTFGQQKDLNEQEARNKRKELLQAYNLKNQTLNNENKADTGAGQVQLANVDPEAFGSEIMQTTQALAKNILNNHGNTYKIDHFQLPTVSVDSNYNQESTRGTSGDYMSALKAYLRG